MGRSVLVGCVCVFAAAAIGLVALPGNANPLGLSSSDIAWLRSKNLTLVAPSWVPDGFRRHASVDRPHDSYTITYEGPGGARFVFEGSIRLAAAGQSSQAKHPSFFAKLSNTVSNLFSKKPSAASNQQSNSANLSNEEEVNPNEMDVVADSHLIGAAHFVPAPNNCAQGESQKGLPPARYRMTACNVVADTLVRVYRSAKIQY